MVRFGKSTFLQAFLMCTRMRAANRVPFLRRQKLNWLEPKSYGLPTSSAKKVSALVHIQHMHTQTYSHTHARQRGSTPTVQRMAFSAEEIRVFVSVWASHHSGLFMHDEDTPLHIGGLIRRTIHTCTHTHTLTRSNVVWYRTKPSRPCQRNCHIHTAEPCRLKRGVLETPRRKAQKERVNNFTISPTTFWRCLSCLCYVLYVCVYVGCMCAIGKVPHIELFINKVYAWIVINA